MISYQLKFAKSFPILSQAAKWENDLVIIVALKGIN